MHGERIKIKNTFLTLHAATYCVIIRAQRTKISKLNFLSVLNVEVIVF